MQWRDLAGTRLGRNELDGSWLKWREFVGSKMGWRQLGGSRLWSIMHYAAPGGQTFEILKIEGGWDQDERSSAALDSMAGMEGARRFEARKEAACCTL